MEGTGRLKCGNKFRTQPLMKPSEPFRLEGFNRPETWYNSFNASKSKVCRVEPLLGWTLASRSEIPASKKLEVSSSKTKVLLM